MSFMTWLAGIPAKISAFFNSGPYGAIAKAALLNVMDAASVVALNVLAQAALPYMRGLDTAPLSGDLKASQTRDYLKQVAIREGLKASEGVINKIIEDTHQALAAEQKGLTDEKLG